MSSSLRRFLGVWSGLVLASLAAVAAGAAVSAHPVKFEIPAGDAAEALSEFSSQSGLQMLFLKQAVDGRQTRAVVGELEPKEALGLLLKESGLTFEFMNERTVAIREEEKGRVAQTGGAGGKDAGNGQQQGEKKEEETPKLEEIVVSAQKKSERLIDVPLPVSEISTDTLLKTNNTRIEDFATQVPSLTFSNNPYGDPIIAIRGVNEAIGVQPTTAALIDDVPYTGSSVSGNTGSVNPINIDPNDVARIEVLRGPQGTLYGATAMGGLLKYVTVTPSTDSLSGRVQLGTNTYDGGGVGYQARGVVNLPLSDTAAVRLSAFRAVDPGYIDAHLSNGSVEKDFNERRTDGGRLAALWKPSDSFSVVVSALYQRDDSDALPNSSIGLPPYQVNLLIGNESTDRTTQFYTAVISAAVGGFDIKSTAGYLKNDLRAIIDISDEFGFLGALVYGADVAGLSNHINNDFSKVTEELRASRSITHWLDWQVGGFYDHETQDFINVNYSSIPATDQVVGTLIHGVGGQFYEEYALYSTATIKFTDRFDVEIGGREAWINNTTDTQTVTGDLFPHFGQSIPIISPTDKFTDNAFTYSFTPRLKISPDTMLYARVASGYRTGAGNGTGAVVDGVQAEYKPDTLINYELGTKSTLLDGRLLVDGSVYYIDWHDLQTAVSGLVGYVTNVGSAKSEGAELSVTARPARGTTIQGWVSWNEAVLTSEPPTGATGRKGDWLPFARRISSHFAVNQEFPLTSQLTGSAGLSWSYAGKSYGALTSPSTGGLFFTPESARQVYPGFSRYDFRVGLQYQKYSVDAYVNNLTNKPGLIGGGIGISDTYQYIKPREFGLQLTAKF